MRMRSKVETPVNKFVTDLDAIVDPCYEAQNPAFGPLNYPFLTKLIRKHDVRKILDVGTGEGSFLLGLAKQVPRTEFHALEVNPALIERALWKQRKVRDRRIRFVCSAFNDRWPVKNYSMILARFAVEHMTDVSGFLRSAHNKLKPGGLLVVIEYLVSTESHGDPIWSEFRRTELALYEKIGSHPRISLLLPALMAEAGFQEIRSSLERVSPFTVGAAFYDLASVYARTYSRIAPRVWSKALTDRVVKWCDRGRKQPRRHDPVMFVTHTVGRK